MKGQGWDLIWQPGEGLDAWGLRTLHNLRGEVALLSGAFYAALEEETLTRIALLGGGERAIQTLRWGEGLVGEAAQLRQALYWPMTENAHQPVGIGRLPARALWILPCLYQEKVWGVVELLLYEDPAPAQRAAVEEVLPLLSALLSSAIQQRRIEKLLSDLQAQNALLAEKIREVSEARAAVEALNASLERRVEERTTELKQTLQELQATQQQLVFSEKMAALGQLIAGIAHEINSPLGAIKGSAETLLESLPTLFRVLLQLQESRPQVLADLWKWVWEVFMTKQRPQMTSREERALRKRLAARLAELSLPEAEDTARRLVEAGLSDESDLEALGPLIVHPEVTELVYLIGQHRLQLENILFASQRTRKVVFALKSYVHTSGDRSTPVSTDLAESIETILTLYQNQLKQGVEVQADYAQGLPKLYLFADEIGQVWTNIIQNAIQAMSNQGQLRVRADIEGDWVRVSFTDSGPGIPPEILPRIFEPFFTTKSRGEGTGLGLDICRRIIEKHHGRMEVASVPGETTFHVLLPLSLQDSHWHHAQSASTSP